MSVHLKIILLLWETFQNLWNSNGITHTNMCGPLFGTWKGWVFTKSFILKTCVIYLILIQLPRYCKGAGIFFGKGGPKFTKKLALIKLQPPPPPILATKILWTPHHRYTLPSKQVKIVLKSVFLNKINTLPVVILWLPTFWSSKILWPPIFLSKNLWPPIYLWPPFQRKCQPPKHVLHTFCANFVEIFCRNFISQTQNIYNCLNPTSAEIEGI